MRRLAMVALSLLLLVGCVQAPRLTEHTTGFIRFLLDERFTTTDEMMYTDESNGMAFMPVLIKEQKATSCQDLLTVMQGQIKLEEQYKSSDFYSQSHPKETMELENDTYGPLPYEILTISYTDGRVIAILATQIEGHFVLCYAGYRDTDKPKVALDTLFSIAKSLVYVGPKE